MADWDVRCWQIFLAWVEFHVGHVGLQVPNRGRIFVYDTCPGRSHVAVVVTRTVARRDRDPSRGRAVRPNWSGIVDVSWVGGSGRLARADLSAGGPQGGTGIRVGVQWAHSCGVCKWPKRGLLVTDAPTGTVDATTPSTLWTTTTPWGGPPSPVVFHPPLVQRRLEAGPLDTEDGPRSMPPGV